MWRHLGALAFLFFVVTLASGIYLYALFDTSVQGAYQSGRALTEDPSRVGTLVRGLHRYGADAFMLFTALHLVREALRGRFRAFRAWSWVSGVVLVPLAWIAGITGFWLAWDERALFSAVATAEWVAAWPFKAEAFARNFLSSEAMSDRFFSLAVFIHLGVPLLALAATWAHFLRLAHVRAWPPAVLGWGTGLALAMLALASPAASLGPPNALSVPASLAIDWFFFFPHALAEWLTPEGLWVVVLGGLGVLAALPWIARGAPIAAARVDLANCNGCGQCAADCPFGAVLIAPRSDGRRHRVEAVVRADLCAACGICVGACPSSTALRSPVATGIDLPAQPIADLRSALDRALDVAVKPVVAFACVAARRRAAALPPRLALMPVECAAMVPPSFIDYALRAGAPGVIVAGCPGDDCDYRLGERWTGERLARVRAPVLRPTVSRERLRVLFTGSDRPALERAVSDLLAHHEARHA